MRNIFKLFTRNDTPQTTPATTQTLSSFLSSSRDITPDGAMSLSTVYACVKLLSETISTLPLNLYEKRGDTKRIAKENPLYQVIKHQPNRFMTQSTLIEVLVASMLLRGNGYLFPVYAKNGQIISLEFLKPQNMFVYDDGSDVYYRYTSKKSKVFKHEDIVNIPYFTTDGFTGMTPIQKCRTALKISIETEEYAYKFYKNGAQPGGVIETPYKFDTQEQIARFKAGWKKGSSGENAHNTQVLEGGATYKNISLNNKDAQYIEGRAFSVQEIARMFRVPPHLIGDLSKATFSNIEQQALEFEKYTIRPIVTKIEAAFNQRLIPLRQRDELFFKFNTDALLRGDLKSRYEAYNIGRNAGFLSANEIRDKEDLNPIENGDIYLQPLNMQEANKQDEQEPTV